MTAYIFEFDDVCQENMRGAPLVQGGQHTIGSARALFLCILEFCVLVLGRAEVPGDACHRLLQLPFTANAAQWLVALFLGGRKVAGGGAVDCFRVVEARQKRSQKPSVRILDATCVTVHHQVCVLNSSRDGLPALRVPSGL